MTVQFLSSRFCEGLIVNSVNELLCSLKPGVSRMLHSLSSRCDLCDFFLIGESEGGPERGETSSNFNFQFFLL